MKQKLSVSEISEINVNQKDENGNTPLHYAVLNSSTIQYVDNTHEPDFALIEKLFSLGADPKITNHEGLHAGVLMNHRAYHLTPDFIPGHTDRIWEFQKKMGDHRKKYYELVLKYQPTFENIQFFIESQFEPSEISGEKWIFSKINVQELSQDCLQSLISWCQKGIKIFNEKVKPCAVYPGSFDKSKVPNYLAYSMDDVKTLLSNCQKELLFLKKFNYFNETAFQKVLQKIVNPSKPVRATILAALSQSKTLQGYFDSIVVQLNELPIEKELKQKIRQLNEELQEWLQPNCSQFLSLNENGEEFINALFNELYETFHAHEAHFDMQTVTSNTTSRWTSTSHQPVDLTSHCEKYKSVLSQISTFDRNKLNKTEKQEDTSQATHSSSSSNSSSSSSSTSTQTLKF